MGGKGAQISNLSRFLSYVRLFYLSALRNSNDEFSSRSQYWGRILRNLKIDDKQRKTLSEELGKINESLLKADPRIEEVRKALEKIQGVMSLGSK